MSLAWQIATVLACCGVVAAGFIALARCVTRLATAAHFIFQVIDACQRLPFRSDPGICQRFVHSCYHLGSFAGEIFPSDGVQIGRIVTARSAACLWQTAAVSDQGGGHP